MTGTALTIPDPRRSDMPTEWVETVAAPAIVEQSWEELDDTEAKLKALASWIEARGGEAVEFEKALRIVEYRRGVLLDPETRQGDRTDLQPRQRIAEVSERTARNYRRIARHWEDLIWPRILAATSIREVSQRNVLRLIKHHTAQAPVEHETLKVEDLAALDDGSIGTVYADPPWLYANQATRASTGGHYEGMTVEEIAAMPIRRLMADEAHCHLWTTNAFLFEAQRVLEAWGFTYKSVFVWVKPQMGIGNYWRVSHEFLLLGTKGSVPFRDHSEMSWREWPRGRHSAKPHPMYDIIEKVSPGPYLELFARNQRKAWISWGKDIERDLFYQEAS